MEQGKSSRAQSGWNKGSLATLQSTPFFCLFGHKLQTRKISCIITDEKLFTRINKTFNPSRHYMKLADVNKMNNVALKLGDAQIELLNSKGRYVKVTLKNALLIPSYPQSIVSVISATANGASVTFTDGHNELQCKNGSVPH